MVLGLFREKGLYLVEGGGCGFSGFFRSCGKFCIGRVFLFCIGFFVELIFGFFLRVRWLIFCGFYMVCLGSVVYG